MSAPARSAGGWVRSTHFEFDADPSHLGGGTAALGGSSTPCPVCRKPHGARLVRSLVVEPMASAPRGMDEDRIDSRYYPPAVPILSRRSSNPINLSARWSLTFA